MLHERIKAANIAPLKLFPFSSNSEKNNQLFVVAYRQKLTQTLEDILSAKPAITASKKSIYICIFLVWMIYQMIKCVYILHKSYNFYHGNISTSNFISTTYGYLMLTDFAFYKPLYMLEDTEEGLP